MSKQRFAGATVILGLLAWGFFATSGYGQEPGRGASPVAPCIRPQNQCPSPSSGGTFVHINLQPDAADSVCRFDQRVVDDLRTTVGDNVHWSFCSTCPLNMQVQLDVPGGSGPFDRFTLFNPFPTADNLVTVDVPCNGFGMASGFNATGSGEWKYFLRARPAGTQPFLDEIDPRLEIDDRTLAPTRRPVLTWAVAGLIGIALGVMVGMFLARRKTIR